MLLVPKTSTDAMRLRFRLSLEYGLWFEGIEDEPNSES
jgi:hypothetical protein